MSGPRVNPSTPSSAEISPNFRRKPPGLCSPTTRGFLSLHRAWERRWSGAHLIAKRGRNTLVIVHRTPLLDQWRAQLGVFLDLNPAHIGQIGGGKRKAKGVVDVAMIQSLVRRDEVDPIVAEYGHVVVDECHHVPAVSFERVMREVRARFVTGLTATPRRRDGHHPILGFQIGPVRFSVDPKAIGVEQALQTPCRRPQDRVRGGEDRRAAREFRRSTRDSWRTRAGTT